MMYIEFMKNFLLADSSELMAVRVISVCWAKDTFDSYFLDIDVRRLHEKFSSRRFENWLFFSWALKRLIPRHFSRHDVRRVPEKFFSRRFERPDGSYSHFGLLNPKTFDSYFLHMMYVEFTKNFLLADSSELLAVRLILASWTQKLLIATFYTWCTSCSWEIFLSPIRATWWQL